MRQRVVPFDRWMGAGKPMPFLSQRQIMGTLTP
jgi:hypothetical protein